LALITHLYKLIAQGLLVCVVGLFCNPGLGCLLSRYGSIIMG